MKILVAVKSHQDMWERGAHEQIRETWGKFCLADVRFFFGGELPGHRDVGFPQLEDEIWLPVGDGYHDLSEKANVILRWAVERGYDYIVLVDTDTFINPVELAKLPWGYFDYAGLLLTWGPPFMFGGCGFALSADAARIVLNNDVKDKMDDISIGKILLKRPQPDIRVLPRVWDRRIGWHYPKNTYSVSNYDPRFPWMRMMAQAHLGFPKMDYRWSQLIGGVVREITLVLSRMDRESV